mmetsp:Transcript_4542/g.11650  ORF Transcript_4542/g.11650 Transcript_4542/m.11650 type:complete len:654 (+) Transcript_4542:121-2082(+)
MDMDIAEGTVTATIYKLIREAKFADAILILEEYSQSFLNSRAALSLLAYCQYEQSEFASAAENYATLVALYPEVDCYQLYHAQALYKACDYEAAEQACLKIKDAMHAERTKLQAAIKFQMDDMATSRALVETCPAEDPDTMVNQACIMYAEQRYDEALAKFNEAMNLVSFREDLAYNIALCHYRRKEFTQALEYIIKIIQVGLERAEMKVGWRTEGIEVRAVENSKLLHQTALIETFNLKASIEYKMKQFTEARDSLTDMPPRSEEELDPVTLHNTALINMEVDVNAGFDKLQFLLQQNPCPPETFGNLLLLYCKYEHFDLAADVLAENTHLTYKQLSPYMYDFLYATITRQTSAEDGFRKLEAIAKIETTTLRKLSEEGKQAGIDDRQYSENASEYDEALERYVPVLMAQAKIYWDLGNYQGVEKLFRNSMDLIVDHDVLRLNIAHVLFMQAVVAPPAEQEGKFMEAITFYEPIVSKSYDEILEISAIVLGNLCVSYILTMQNDKAEEIMGKIEREEEHLAYEFPDRKVYHHCIVNLVIGTLYCAKGNFEFGITRVIKCAEPVDKKLGTQTWMYIRNCFCALLERMAKMMVNLKDDVADECIDFLETCEVHGRAISTTDDVVLDMEALDVGRKTVTYEARYLKALMIKLVHE